MELSPIAKDSHLQILMVTDIHLGKMPDARGQALLRLIDQALKWKIEYFVLGGDIFDFCQGTHPYFRAKFAELGAALGKLDKCGCKVIFVEGNHEFDLAGLNWPGVECMVELQKILTLSNGTKVALTHGDQIYNNRRYRLFRWLVKSTLVRWLARYVVPAKLLDWYTSRHSQISRAADRYRSLDHHQLISTMANWLRSTGAQHGLFGHFHVPYFQTRTDGTEGFIVSCESWDRPNALVMMSDRFYRLYWDRHTQQWNREPAIELSF